MSSAGCLVLTPPQGRCVDIPTRFGVRLYQLDYVRGVAMAWAPGARAIHDETGAHAHSTLPLRRPPEGPVPLGAWLHGLVTRGCAGSAGQVSRVVRG
ncbi:phosphatase [Streptomyces clavuligerus]|uniref:Uncharacterized protein n=1 Tax=Streptomyces clavuligerus TaxID=1901 RepID=E2Q7M2_STRCL|nr:phosphatase [Streptomyces clavuligerus]EFG07428.1 Hypothetical protein SCLAV_2355 [Streptomyces clavuligerus]